MTDHGYFSIDGGSSAISPHKDSQTIETKSLATTATSMTPRLPKIILRDTRGRELDTESVFQTKIYEAKWRLQHGGAPSNSSDWRLPHVPVVARPDFSRVNPEKLERLRASRLKHGFSSHLSRSDSFPGSLADIGEEENFLPSSFSFPENLPNLATAVLKKKHVRSRSSDSAAYYHSSQYYRDALENAGDKVFLPIAWTAPLHNKELSETEKRENPYVWPGLCTGCQRVDNELCYGCEQSAIPHLHKVKPVRTGGGFTYYKRDYPKQEDKKKNPLYWKTKGDYNGNIHLHGIDFPDMRKYGVSLNIAKSTIDGSAGDMQMRSKDDGDIDTKRKSPSKRVQYADDLQQLLPLAETGSPGSELSFSAPPTPSRSGSGYSGSTASRSNAKTRESASQKDDILSSHFGEPLHDEHSQQSLIEDDTLNGVMRNMKPKSPSLIENPSLNETTDTRVSRPPSKTPCNSADSKEPGVQAEDNRSSPVARAATLEVEPIYLTEDTSRIDEEGKVISPGTPGSEIDKDIVSSTQHTSLHDTRVRTVVAKIIDTSNDPSEHEGRSDDEQYINNDDKDARYEKDATGVDEDDAEDVEDAGAGDAGVEDAGAGDASVDDAGAGDASVDDAGADDASVDDAGVDPEDETDTVIDGVESHTTGTYIGTEETDANTTGLSLGSRHSRRSRGSLYKAPKAFEIKRGKTKVTKASDPFAKDRDIQLPKYKEFTVTKSDKPTTEFVDFEHKPVDYQEPKQFQLKEPIRKPIEPWTPPTKPETLKSNSTHTSLAIDSPKPNSAPREQSPPSTADSGVVTIPQPGEPKPPLTAANIDENISRPEIINTPQGANTIPLQTNITPIAQTEYIPISGQFSHKPRTAPSKSHTPKTPSLEISTKPIDSSTNSRHITPPNFIKTKVGSFKSKAKEVGMASRVFKAFRKQEQSKNSQIASPDREVVVLHTQTSLEIKDNGSPKIPTPTIELHHSAPLPSPIDIHDTPSPIPSVGDVDRHEAVNVTPLSSRSQFYTDPEPTEPTEEKQPSPVMDDGPKKEVVDTSITPETDHGYIFHDPELEDFSEEPVAVTPIKDPTPEPAVKETEPTVPKLPRYSIKESKKSTERKRAGAPKKKEPVKKKEKEVIVEKAPTPVEKPETPPPSKPQTPAVVVTKGEPLPPIRFKPPPIKMAPPKLPVAPVVAPPKLPLFPEDASKHNHNKTAIEKKPVIEHPPIQKKPTNTELLAKKRASQPKRRRTRNVPNANEEPKDLRTMHDPLNYLAKYCIIQPERMPYYERVFNRTLANQGYPYDDIPESRIPKGQTEPISTELPDMLMVIGNTDADGDKLQSLGHGAITPHEVKMITDHTLINRVPAYKGATGLGESDEYVNKLSYTLDNYYDRYDNIQAKLDELKADKNSRLITMIRKHHPEIMRSDYVAPKKKGKKKDKKNKSSKTKETAGDAETEQAEEEPTSPRILTNEMIIERLDTHSLAVLEADPDISQMNLELERMKEKIHEIDDRIEDLEDEKKLMLVYSRDQFHRNEIDQANDAQFLRKQSALYQRLNPQEDLEMNLVEVEEALQHINNNLISQSEMAFIFHVLDLPGRRRINLKLFSAVAALSEKITQVEPLVRKLINKLDFQALTIKTDRCKELFYLLDEKDFDVPTGKVSARNLGIDLIAGGVSPENTEYVMSKFNREHKGVVDFLDYLIYIPLFIEIHERIVMDPLNFIRNL
ncbi:unnamed protein product [Owenia fusiformis]|uniref:Uncharacterized protein n=1 Tax=Owenia fusiformis TaxID=6347 RepID=A0A8J1UVQ6_OWEFU|nr:unnamed protein product [Owenia fusiformis]